MQEKPHGRYIDTFKRQFTDQSVRLLQRDTSGSGVPSCVCMVALQPETDRVLATCDVRPPANIAGVHPEGVPGHDATGCYITNVAVDPDTRGQGLGFQLLEAAATYAVEQWQAQAAYTTVETSNKVCLGWTLQMPALLGFLVL